LGLALNKITMLPLGVFGNLSNLLVLILNSNSITILPSGVFGNLSNLQKLYLNYNFITMLPSGVFGSLSNLHVLNVGHNAISALRANIFNNLTMLQYLSLNFNKISVLLEGFLGNLTKIIELDLDHNSLVNLSSVPFKSFQQNSPRILLSNNNFTIISRILFPSKSIIDLSYNNISVIAADMHSSWGSPSSLFMSGNPSVCSVRYNLLPAVFPCFNASGGNTTLCSQVFCTCAHSYVGTDVCVPETDAYLKLPLLLSAYSNALVGSVADAFSVVSGLDAFKYFQNQNKILSGNPVLSYSVSNISSVNASFSIPWTTSVFQLDAANFSRLLESDAESFIESRDCYFSGLCTKVLSRYIVGSPSVALSSSIGNPISNSVTALMNPDVPTNVSFVFRNPQCLLPGGAYCRNYSLASVLVNYTDSILANSTGSSPANSTGSSTLQLSGSFSYSTKFSV
jgi:Leucine rich repeat